VNLTRRPSLGWALIIASSLLFGLNASTTKVLVHAGFDPTFLVPYRSSATAVLALVAVLITNPRSLKVGLKELGTLALFGVVGLALMQWSYTNAVSRLPVGISLLIEYTAAIWVPLANWAIYKRKPARGLWLGVAVAIVGLLAVSSFWNAQLDPVGIMFAAMTALFVTFYFLIAEHTQSSRDVWSTLFYSMTFSAAFWWILTPPKPGSIPDLSHLIALGGNLAPAAYSGWVMLIWVGIMGSFVPMLLNYLAIRFIDTNSVGVGSLSEVVFAFLFGFLWLAESVTGIQLVGSVLVLIGILVAQRATANKPDSGQ
jgi:drug/metabolite transporter (DMT)-like permease